MSVPCILQKLCLALQMHEGLYWRDILFLFKQMDTEDSCESKSDNNATIEQKQAMEFCETMKISLWSLYYGTFMWSIYLNV